METHTHNAPSLGTNAVTQLVDIFTAQPHATRLSLCSGNLKNPR